MSVVGYDFGNLNAYIAVARQGGIDVLTNDYSLHATPLCVGFGHKSRVMGVAARQQVNTNFKNTVMNFKHMLGRKFSDPVTQLYKHFVPCETIQLSNDEIGFKVNYMGQARILTPEQVMAAFLVKLKQITEDALGSVVNECVVSVPYFFSDNQRRALLASGKIAGINLLKIVNENTAVGIAFGIYKGSLLPAENEKPKLVAFVDVGHSCVQASLMAFNDRKVSMLGATHDLTVGGLFFDDLIREEFHKDFLQKYKIDAKSNPRAWQRLLDECERVKKQMSANSTAIPLNIECFMEEKDVTGKMQRVEFEALAEPLFQKIRDLLRKLIEQTGVRIEDISEVELIGGSSRIPLIKQIVAHFFNREPKTTMNLDEAVARGAGMQCAIISPSFKVKEFHVHDINLFDIKLRYEGSNGQQDTVIFKRQDEFPYSKLLTLEKKAPFQVEAYYGNAQELPYPDNFIGRWAVNDVTPTKEGEPRKVRVKVRLNHNGLLIVPLAATHEILPPDEDEPMEEEPAAGDATTATNGGEAGAQGQDQQQAEGAENKDEKAAAKKEKKPRKVNIEYPVQEFVPYSLNVDDLVHVEREMQFVDTEEKLKSDSKNAVEEYCYNMRDNLGGSLAEFVSQEEASKFLELLSQTETWLYEDGEDVSRADYDDKLAELRQIIETPINAKQQAKQEAAAAEAAQPEEPNGGDNLD